MLAPMRRLPKGVDPKSLPDLAHYRGHGIERITVWCHTPLCFHQSPLTFADLAAHGARDTTTLWEISPRLKCTVCGRKNAELQPDWSQRGS
jgi:hypothetical protein